MPKSWSTLYGSKTKTDIHVSEIGTLCGSTLLHQQGPKISFGTNVARCSDTSKGPVVLDGPAPLDGTCCRWCTRLPHDWGPKVPEALVAKGEIIGASPGTKLVVEVQMSRHAMGTGSKCLKHGHFFQPNALAHLRYQGDARNLSATVAAPTTRAFGGQRPLLRVENRAMTACIASSPDSDLEAFSHNLAHGRAKMEGSKSKVAMNAWLPQASYPCVTRSHGRSSSNSALAADKFWTGTPVPCPQSQSFSRGYGSILPTSLAYIVPLTISYSPWRPDAVMNLHRRSLRMGSAPGFTVTFAPFYSSAPGPFPDSRGRKDQPLQHAGVARGDDAPAPPPLGKRMKRPIDGDRGSRASKYQGADGTRGSRTTKGLSCRWCPRLPQDQGPRLPMVRRLSQMQAPRCQWCPRLPHIQSPRCRWCSRLPYDQGPSLPMVSKAPVHRRHQGADAARGFYTSEAPRHQGADVARGSRTSEAPRFQCCSRLSHHRRSRLPMASKAPARPSSNVPMLPHHWRPRLPMVHDALTRPRAQDRSPEHHRESSPEHHREPNLWWGHKRLGMKWAWAVPWTSHTRSISPPP
ncbi:hypothetical protein GOBAR_AA11938 [Gossypium barbadense]|uniref:Uncharacterized protein n=1 Tax=Gossypium barbadense TaxID=3634 RepID=A0A2P5XZF4_GOSBA|nr:hypothetical protein GOBAR_AA11938 [Gossypium barbadense]